MRRLYIDEVFVKIGGKQQYLWRAISSSTELKRIMVGDTVL